MALGEFFKKEAWAEIRSSFTHIGLVFLWPYFMAALTFILGCIQGDISLVYLIMVTSLVFMGMAVGLFFWKELFAQNNPEGKIVFGTQKSQKLLKQMVHYVCEKCDDPGKLGATKLNKVLWYADTISYRLNRKTISGESAYLKQKYGPVPKNIVSVINQLGNEGTILIRSVPYFDKTKKEYISLKPISSSVFDDDQKAILDFAIEHVCDHHTAASISEETHDIIWDAAEMGEEIPILAVLASTVGELTKAHMSWADKIIEKRHSKTAKKSRHEAEVICYVAQKMKK